jgi:hypothetical protein
VTGRRKSRKRKRRKRKRRRRLSKLLDELNERREYSQPKEEAVDRTMWRAGFGKGLWTYRETDC